MKTIITEIHTQNLQKNSEKLPEKLPRWTLIKNEKNYFVDVGWYNQKYKNRNIQETQ